MINAPLTCGLTSEAIRAGRAGLLPGLLDRAAGLEPVENGYRVTFVASTDALLAIAHVIDAERQCCRWLRFDLSVPADGAPIVLTLTGPAGAREFLEAVISYT